MAPHYRRIQESTQKAAVHDVPGLRRAVAQHHLARGRGAGLTVASGTLQGGVMRTPAMARAPSNRSGSELVAQRLCMAIMTTSKCDFRNASVLASY